MGSDPWRRGCKWPETMAAWYVGQGEPEEAESARNIERCCRQSRLCHLCSGRGKGVGMMEVGNATLGSWQAPVEEGLQMARGNGSVISWQAP